MTDEELVEHEERIARHFLESFPKVGDIVDALNGRKARVTHVYGWGWRSNIITGEEPDGGA